jgi:hypothetical protein
VSLNSARLSAMIVACSSLFCTRAMAQHVVAFAPSAPVLPANTLRVYFVFDRPARGFIPQSEVQLIGSDGKRIEDPFMDFGTELWSPDGKRLTILFDPGKIKRGVEAPNSELAPLKAGATYTIRLRGFQKRFRVGAAVRKRLDPAAWRIVPPDTRKDAIRIEFDRVMDFALLQDQICVYVNNQLEPSFAVVEEGGNALKLIPVTGWKAGKHEIRISAILEDVAGNRLGEAMDHLKGDSADGDMEKAVFTFNQR